MMKLLHYYLIVSMVTFSSAQTSNKTVMTSAGNAIINSEATISFTIGEPLIGMIHDGESIDQGFWAGSLQVEPITQEENLIGIRVYPNPVVDELNIYTDGNQVDGITLFAVDGKRVLKQKVEASVLEHNIEMSYLAKGIYVLRLLIEGTNESKLFKIIKK